MTSLIIIYVEPAKFDNLRTNEMAAEIDAINREMLAEGRKYVLIGPGRWGTKDRFLGIPVEWPQISNAKIIVEVSMPNFHIDASQAHISSTMDLYEHRIPCGE